MTMGLPRKKSGAHMTNDEKERVIGAWIDPEERATVHFLGAPDLNAQGHGLYPDYATIQA